MSSEDFSFSHFLDFPPFSRPFIFLSVILSTSHAFPFLCALKFFSFEILCLFSYFLMPQIAFLTLRVNPETRGEAMRRRLYENEADIKRGGERRKEKIKCKSFRVEEKKMGEGVKG